MNKKMSKRQRDIKTKLMAAICMLLVSSIMMVSTTYAWFTLSTAPEVTGIQTAVGANGNLEMALQPYSGDLNAITSSDGDSLKLPLERNITWGNLVDVSDNASYGMNNIVLYPAQLNVVDGVIGQQPLATPVYGADGRISEIRANTLTGAFDPIKLQFAESMTYGGASYTNPMGVRAIGVSSNMSARELAHRNAVASAISEKSSANTAAGKTLNANGSAIGNIAVKHGLGNDGAGYTQEEIQPLKNAVNDLDAIAVKIENALKNYLIANSIAPASAEATYADIVKNINAAASLEAAEQVTGAIVPTDSDYATAKAKLAELKTDIATAKGINDLNGDAISWNELSGKLTVLVNMELITVNGMYLTDIQKDAASSGYKDEDGTEIDGKAELVNRISNNDMVAEINMPSGSGVFADIADFTGNYSAAFKMKVSYSGVSINANTEMYAVAGKTTGIPYLDNITTSTFDSGSDNSSSAKPITTFYGYIIDLAFRTNAAGSYLQLQSEGIDRIYTDGSSNPDTMGHGATMSFKTDSATFGQAGVKGLMSAIRVVFFDTTTREIIGYARLDSSSAENNGDYIVMPLVMTDAAGAPITKTIKVQNEDGTEEDKIVNAPEIMELEQNTATALSVMVYLDGAAVKNEHVAADAAQSMVGSMNLQFSSSATLKPMDYADLKTEGASNVDSYQALNNVKVPTGYTYRAYAYGNKVGIQLTPPSGISLDSATIKAKVGTGDSAPEYTATAGEFAGKQGYVVTLDDGVTVDSNTEITITVEGATTSEPVTPTTYTVGLATDSLADVTLSENAAAATANTAYTFKLTAAEGVTVTSVSYTVDGTDKGTLDASAEGVYTIPAENVTGAILIKVS